MIFLVDIPEIDSLTQADVIMDFDSNVSWERTGEQSCASSLTLSSPRSKWVAGTGHFGRKLKIVLTLETPISASVLTILQD